MPLNRPALPLGTGPRGVQDARRWVVRTCLDIGRPDLVECAELAVSELVTNALLHGAPPIQLKVCGTREHPRVEVRDASTEPPRPRAQAAVGGDLPLTGGRGLSIVARGCEAWGTDIEDDGKVVWFTPAPHFVDGPGRSPLITGDEAARRPSRRTDLVEIEVRNVPIAAYLGCQHHYAELRREIRLLALANATDAPLAESLNRVFSKLDQPLRNGQAAEQIESARAAGHRHADLHLLIDRGAAHHVTRLLELLDLADALCREQRLRSLARSADQRRFQAWFLGEFARQAAGEQPLPWPLTVDAPVRRTPIS